MDNLINFDEIENINKSPETVLTKPLIDGFPMLVPQKVQKVTAADLNNPFDKLEFRLDHINDPFECIESAKIKNSDPKKDGLQDGSMFSFECFSNVPSIDSSHLALSQDSSLSSEGSQKTVVSRSHSDSSTISSNSNRPASKANISVDNNMYNKNQLLKLSFLNSPNSPMSQLSFNNSSVADNIEAKRIARKYADSTDQSFEDLNNVSQHLVDASNDVSITDCDLLQMKVKVLSKGNNLAPPIPSARNISRLHEQLKRIKQETDPDGLPQDLKINVSSTPIKLKIELCDEESDVKPVIKEESKLTPKVESEPQIVDLTADDSITEDDTGSELDGLLQNLKSIINDGNKEEAKKQLQRLNELLGKQKEPQENKNTLHVQPIVRQDTFEIDDKTGKRKYNPSNDNNQKTENDDLIEKLTKLLGAQSLNIHSLNGDSVGAKLVVVVPAPTVAPVATPLKQNRRVSLAPRPQSAYKPIENKKLSTPMKRLTHAPRQSTFTTPRPMTTSKANPYEQRTGTQPKINSVRKSLLGAIESPQVQKSKVSSTTTSRMSTAGPRRSVSMKASIPSVQVSKASPVKKVPRPSTGAPYAVANKRSTQIPSTPGKPTTMTTAARRTSTLFSSRTRTLSEHKKPISQFKAPSAVRRAAAAAAENDPRGDLV